MQITRRDALMGAAAVAATGAVPVAAMAKSTAQDPLREGVQALVNEIRQGHLPITTTHAFWALQEAADRLEALPGIQAVPNEHWTIWRKDMGRWKSPRMLRPAGEA